MWRRGTRHTRAPGSVLAVAALAIAALGSCSSDPQAEPAPLRVELIRKAISVVDADLGAPQRFFEVNATPTIVNLFVATDNATEAVAYVYAAGKLEVAAAAQPSSGPTFGSSDIDLDDTRVLAQVRKELPTSDFRLFSITAAEAGGVQYRVVIDSSQGTEFVVSVSGNGAILGTDQNLGIGDS